LGLIVPNNNEDKVAFLRIRNDIEKDTTIKLAERENMLAEGPKYYWHEGEGVMFDDNPLHDATNNGDTVRVVLFLDVYRTMPWWLDKINKFAVWIAGKQKQLRDMRARAVVREDSVLSKG
jgi:beta-hydroxylase